MAYSPWEDIAIPLLRGIIDDTSSPYTYSEDKLEELLIYAAYFMNQEISFITTYTITVPTFNISPDPSTNNTDGKLFIVLMVLKSAVMVLRGEVKVASAQAVRVVDGPTSIDATGVYKAKKDLLDQLQKDYDMAKTKAMIGDFSVGEAILTPYTQENL